MKSADPEEKNTGSGFSVATLLILAMYFGARAELHGRALGLLLSGEYHGREPLAAGAFPSSANPFEWRGVVSTDNTIEEIEISLNPEADFNPDRSLTHYKPEDVAPLRAAQDTRAVQRFLQYAQFPLASVSRHEDGYRFELRDVRFPAADENPANIVVREELDSDSHITHEELRYALNP